ncbi:DUF5060 domain-containing protein [Maribellus comscasis]|uniref:DUF5060 domain-containing protein n=1 Tax=Maribellus comscasis TaxID=2681766 RepID=A0A6I6JWI8_9BACT|nr:DUF5060 domain-containing protein [Maribellus comscasis]QGY42124.1 DUF5060 domain-containing protein [Maribellus comscasis]
MKNVKNYLLILLAFFFASCAKQNQLPETEQWDVFQLSLFASVEGNPFMNTEISAEFVNGDKRILVPGFYDGNDTFRIRFSPPVQGVWKYKTQSNNNDLLGKTGEFLCVPPTGENHGPVKVVNTWYLQYADSTPFYSVGTTAYQWTSVKQSIQEQTLETMAKVPFNKIRMCVFPKSYIYGNETEPWRYPFERINSKNNFENPDIEFFQNFDKRIKQLCDLGIQADVILFHPYDRWGYSKMGSEMNKRYVRYMVARISAYRNVWWSLANEWDIPDIKETIDWEGIGTLLQNEDPYQRMRGIHNWYGSEDHFYDHSRPWLTHVSAQTSQFYNAEKWRKRYKKPLMFDEMRYEGDVPSDWGNLSGEEMVSYFWMAGLSGGYGTHGETYTNDSDTSEVRWWSKGGTCVGESPERIVFFQSILEQAPVTAMKPELNDKGDPENLNNNVYIFSKHGAYYLAYVADPSQSVEINLPGDSSYKLEVIDTWNMKTLEEKTIDSGTFKYITKHPYCALKITVN